MEGGRSRGEQCLSRGPGQGQSLGLGLGGQLQPQREDC